MTKVKYSKTLNEEDLQWQTTSNGRHPPIEEDLKKLNISEPLTRSSSNLKFKLRGPNQNKKKRLEKKATTNGRMEEELKIFKVEYLSNHWSDFPKILNLSLGDQTKIKTA